MLAATITALLLALLAIGTPVAFALALAGAAGLYAIGGFEMLAGVLGTAPLSGASSYELITVPMFLLMAEFVIISGVADKLFEAAAAWTGRIPGGLGVATAIAGAGFGAISGSSTAAAATLASTSIPAMLKAGYEPRLACGAVAISGTLAMLIPPSIALVLYGIIGDVSIGKLLIGGVLPGILVTLAISLTIMVLVAIEPARAPRGRAHAWGEKFRALLPVWPMLVLFMAVTGVIYIGVATPTEAAAIGALGAYVIALARGKAPPAATLKALLRAAQTTCMIVLIIVGAQIFAYFFTVTQTTQQIAAAGAALDVNRWVIMAAIVGVYLVLGCFMDQVAILILTVPVALPLVHKLGFDPVWFGVLVIVTAEVGMVTPPVGLNVFVVARYTRRPVAEVFRGVGPHVLAHLIVIALLCLFPQLVLWLPESMRTP
jgi:tripartite ATP-independent transporter DctM subunit